MRILAEHDGTCPCGCQERIIPGKSMITYSDEFGWVKSGHEKKPDICPTCHMALPKSGVCDEC